MKALTSAMIALVLLFAVGAPGRAHGIVAQQFPTIQVPAGYTIEKVVDKLTFATGMTWDDQGRMYVAEAGGGFLEEAPPSRILRIEPGKATEVVNLAGKGVRDSVVGLTWYQGAFYFTHRADDFTGAVSRVTMDGTVTSVLSGFSDSRSEHQVNDIRVGPDGKMYLATGPAGNSGVIGLDIAPFVGLSPDLKTTPCRDYVLTGQNFMTPDFRTMDVPDTTLTGAFVPFGTATTPGQRIAGNNKCGGAIMQFDPGNAEATLRPYVDGMRNVIGFAWNKQGEMYAAVNGYDVRGSRPVNDEWDATYRVREGAWYGFPDFSAALEPLTDPKFDSPDPLQAPIVVNGQPQGKALGFVIDHAASGLTPPDRGLVAGLHEFGSSPSLIDFAPDGWGDLAGRLFVAEFGDLSPATNPLRAAPTGYQVTYIDPATNRAVPFARNAKPGPASGQNAMGMGLERPFDVKFGPDGALYISDYGVVQINPADAEKGDDPYEFPPQTGAIWKITRTAGAPLVTPPPPAAPRPPDPSQGPPPPSQPAPNATRMYRVTIQNMTAGQPMSPPVAAMHQTGMHMFQLEQLASEELEAIAEDGNETPMFGLLSNSARVSQAVNVGKPLTPRGVEKVVMGMPVMDSATFEIRAAPGDKFSVATMLICTNDGFTGLDAVDLPETGSRAFMLNSYDAGTENNTEQSQDIVDPCSLIGPMMLPGDADGNVGMGPADSPISTKPQAAIRAHPGIGGGGELTAAHGWSDPVAQVTITRIDAQPAPPSPPPPAALPDTGVEGAPLTFPETGYSLEGDFLSYWRVNGGLPVFGYPIDSARQIDGRVTQYLERTRFEAHPANKAPYTVLLGRLGVEALEQQGRDWRSFPRAAASTPHYFTETGHAIASQFWDYYRSHGLEFGDRGMSVRESLALFGYPVSEAQMETNADGHRVLTQWFERARFEYHPSNPAASRILLGRLGAEIRNERGR